MAPMRLGAAAAVALCTGLLTRGASAGDSPILAGPPNATIQPYWLEWMLQWRNTTLAAVNYSGAVYDEYIPWTERCYIAPQSHLWDRFLFDADAGLWTVDRFLDDLEARYGGIDCVLLWASYPNLGVDDRDQFTLLLDAPGGVDGLKAAFTRFAERNVHVLLPYNPWAQNQAPRNASDADTMAATLAATGAAGFNGDTMTLVPREFFDAALAAGVPPAIQPEGGGTYASLAWTKMGWAYWTTQWSQPYSGPAIPPVDAFRWLERRRLTQHTSRWVPTHLAVGDLAFAWFNGNGFNTWESIWGVWNGLSDRDAAAVRRLRALLHFAAPFFVTQDWTPHDLVVPAAYDAQLFASRWASPAGAAFPHAATLWTVVSRGATGYSGPVVPLPCNTSGVLVDVYAGTTVQLQQLPGGGCAASLSVEPYAFSGLMLLDAADAPSGNATLSAFLSTMADLTAVPLASLSDDAHLLSQFMLENPATPPYPVPAGPSGGYGAKMVYVPGVTGWSFAVDGTEVEPPQSTCITAQCERVDVQYPWEGVSVRAHQPAPLNVSSFFIDATPVTAAAYAAFLADSGYWPADAHNFLKAWGCSGPGSCTYPQGWAAKPVTWVGIEDARAFCTFVGKRLPNDWEWQLAAQGTDGRAYPWGDTPDATRVPAPVLGGALPALPDVGSFPQGASPSGMLDAVGLVWQWTNEFRDAHTRGGLQRGGSVYHLDAQSKWYYPNPLPSARVDTHNKWLLWAPSYDRAGTVGFRCAADAAQ